MRSSIDYNKKLHRLIISVSNIIYMQTAQPKTKIQDFLEKLSVMIKSASADEFTLLRIERETRDLLNKKIGDPAELYMVLSIVAYLKRDRKLAIDTMSNALALAPNNISILSSASVVYGAMGEVKLANSVLRKISALTPDDKSYVLENFGRAFSLCQIELAINLLEQFDKLTVNDPPKYIILRTPLLAMTQSFKEVGLSEGEYLDRQETAVEAVRENGYEVCHTSCVTGDDQGSFIITFHIDADEDVCAQVNFSIAEALIEKHENTGMDLVTINTRPLSHYPHVPEFA